MVQLTEKAALSDSAKFKIIESLLPVIDNFELAKSNLKVETEEALKTQAAYEQLYKQLVDIFRNLGLKVVATVGEVFDPEVHDAIMQEPTTEFADGVVMQVSPRISCGISRVLRISFLGFRGEASRIYYHA